MQGESVISDELRARYAAGAAVEVDGVTRAVQDLEGMPAARPAALNVVVDEADAVA